MKTINHPDVLGYITGGVRQSIGVLHGAVAVRPRDAVEWAGELVEGATGIGIGGLEERAAYAGALRAKSGVTFSQAYLPLIIGGILINDSLLIEREDPTELLKGISRALEARLPDLDENDAPIQKITDLLLERTARRYGYKLN